MTTVNLWERVQYIDGHFRLTWATTIPDDEQTPDGPVMIWHSRPLTLPERIVWRLLGKAPRPPAHNPTPYSPSDRIR